MTTPSRRPSVLLLPLLVLYLSTVIVAAATSAENWVGTWAAAPMAAKNPGAKFGAPGTDGTTLLEDVPAGGSAASTATVSERSADGAHSCRDGNARWPADHAHRLQTNKKTESLGVLNEGIGGNRILPDATGPSALPRFDRDVLAQA